MESRLRIIIEEKEKHNNTERNVMKEVVLHGML
jgi:hypothetical protein